MTNLCAWTDCPNEADGLFCPPHQAEADAFDKELLDRRARQRVEAMLRKPHVTPVTPMSEERLHEIGRVVAAIERANMTEDEFRELVAGKPNDPLERFERAARLVLMYAALFLAGCFGVIALQWLGVW